MYIKHKKTGEIALDNYGLKYSDYDDGQHLLVVDLHSEAEIMQFPSSISKKLAWKIFERAALLYQCGFHDGGEAKIQEMKRVLNL